MSTTSLSAALRQRDLPLSGLKRQQTWTAGSLSSNLTWKPNSKYDDELGDEAEEQVEATDKEEKAKDEEKEQAEAEVSRRVAGDPYFEPLSDKTMG
jgi:uncharacterized protein YwqG